MESSTANRHDFLAEMLGKIDMRASQANANK